MGLFECLRAPRPVR